MVLFPVPVVVFKFVVLVRVPVCRRMSYVVRGVGFSLGSRQGPFDTHITPERAEREERRAEKNRVRTK